MKIKKSIISAALLLSAVICFDSAAFAEEAADVSEYGAEASTSETAAEAAPETEMTDMEAPAESNPAPVNEAAEPVNEAENYTEAQAAETEVSADGSSADAASYDETEGPASEATEENAEIIEEEAEAVESDGEKAHDHTVEVIAAVPATLFTTGLTEGSRCSVCGEILTAQQETPVKELTSVLSTGSKGDDVLEVQKKLYELGYLTVNPDGVYGQYTYAAVMEFQTANGCAKPDGKIGNWSISVLRGNPVAKNSNSAALTSDDIYGIQTRLSELGFLTSEYDGYFGSLTQDALKKFQVYNGISVTGTIDTATLNALNSVNACGFRLLQKGCTGNDVKNLQTALKNLGYLTVTPDGIFGNMTQAAVKEFQSDNNMNADGAFGKVSLSAIINAAQASGRGNISDDTGNSDSGNSDSGISDTGNLEIGATGTRVLELQKALVNLGYLSGSADGVFGNNTLTALKGFQLYNGLSVTGVADTETLNLISSGNALAMRTLQIGTTGDDVAAVQFLLAELGYLDATPTGYYGELTYSAVNEFQKAYGLKGTDGMFGSMCLSIAVKEAAGLGGETENKNTDTVVPPVIDQDTYLGSQIVAYAMQWVGVTPYVNYWDRMDDDGNISNSLTTGTDCSGFTMLIYSEFGISLPAASLLYQDSVGTQISYDELLPGDVVVYRNGEHVAIYAGKDDYGNDRIIHCATPESGTVYGAMMYQVPTAYLRVIQ